MRSVVLASLVATTVFGSGDVFAVEKITQRFGQEPLDPRIFRTTGSTPEHPTVSTKGTGLLIQLKGDGGPRQAGVKALFGLEGDFEISFAFEIPEPVTPSSGYGSGVILRLRSATNPDRNIGFGCRTRRDGTTVFNTNVTQKISGKREQDEVFFDAEATKGTLRLTRTSSVIQFQVSEEGQDAIRDLRQIEFVTDSIVDLQLLADTGGDTNGLTAILESFAAEAEELPFATSTVEKSATWGVWLAFTAAGVCVILVAVFQRRRRNR